jgi:transposase
MEITTIGLDLAKKVFQVHAINGAGEVVVRKAMRRGQVLRFFERLDRCLVGIEACGTSHYWARAISKFGHEVRLMPPAYVKPYVKRGKTDASDAEAICEAVSRPTMRYVAIKSYEQQAALSVHRTRNLLVKQRTQLVNMIRGLLAEFGIEIRRGITHALSLAERIAAGEMPDIPALAAKMIESLAGQALYLQTRLREIEGELLAWHRSKRHRRAACDDPGCGHRLCHSVRRFRHGSAPVPIRTAVRCLARPHAAPAFERRQGTAWEDIEDGRQISAQAADRRHDLAHQPRKAQA